MNKLKLILFLFAFAPFLKPFGASANTIKIIDSLNDISYDLGNSFPDSSFKTGQRSFEFASKIDYVNGQITALSRMGRIIYKKDLLDSAMYYFDKAEALFYRKGKDSLFLAKVFVYQGLISRKLGRFDEALNKYHESYDVANALNDELLMGECLINISNIYKTRSDLENSLQVLHQSLSQFSPDNYNQLGSVYLNIGNIQDKQARYAESLTSYKLALDNYQKANNNFSSIKCIMNIGGYYLSMNNPDSAFLYFNQANSIAAEYGLSSIQPKIYHNIGEAFLLNGIIDSSLVYFQKSLQLKEINENITGQAISNERIGDIYILKNETEKGLNSYLKSYETADFMQSYTDLSRIAIKLSSTYNQLNNLKLAVKYQNLGYQFQDTINKSINASLIYEINYNDEKYKVKELRNELQLQTASAERQKIMIWAIIGIGGVIIIFLSVVFWQKRKNLKSQKRIDSLIENQDKFTFNAMLDGQENERNRIAGELHDKLGGMLSMVKLYFKSMDKQIDKLKEENIIQFEKANSLLDEACEETRKIAHELSSGVLTKMGLFAAVQSLTDKVEDSGEIKMLLSTHGTDDDLKMLNEIAIYRIVQELVSNTLKHANAKDITIQLNVFDDLFNIIFEDNGNGFNIKQMATNSGMGLRGIEARIQNMNGILSIDSNKGAGTAISIDIPIKKTI